MSKIKYLRALRNPNSLPLLTVEVVISTKTTGYFWWKKTVLGYAVVVVRKNWIKGRQEWTLLRFTEYKYEAFALAEYFYN